jgi:hypothetical protein
VISAVIMGLRNFQVANPCLNKYVRSTGWSVDHNIELKKKAVGNLWGSPSPIKFMKFNTNLVGRRVTSRTKRVKAKKLVTTNEQPYLPKWMTLTAFVINNDFLVRKPN